MSYGWHDVVGNFGVAGIVTAYLLLQTGRMRADQVSYSVLNALGAALIIVSLVVDFNTSAMIIEVFWLLLSLYGIARWRRRARPAGEGAER